MDTSKHPTSIPLDAMVDMRVLNAHGLKRVWVYAQLAKGRFPEPVFKGGRFTRWRWGSIVEYLRDPAGWLAANKPTEGARHETVDS